MAWFERENDKQLYYEEFGSKEKTTLILLNGIVYTTASWYYQKKHLTDRFHIVSYDMRCQGKSSKEQSQFDYTVHVEDLKALIEHLKIAKPILAGISYGTFVAKEFAIRYPALIDGVVLMAPLRRVDFVTGLVYSNWESFLKRDMLKEFYDLALYKSYADIRKNISSEIYPKALKKFTDEFDCQSILFLLNSFDRIRMLQDYNRIQVPTLIIGAAGDSLHNPHDAQAVHAEIGGSQLVMLDGGHAINLENYVAVNAALKRFMS